VTLVCRKYEDPGRNFADCFRRKFVERIRPNVKCNTALIQSLNLTLPYCATRNDR
jgi:hypothetical protein